MGTDELRRDLAIGLLWGTPLALFIGISVSIGSVVVGLVYGVYSGYRGKKTDEVMMRFNDVHLCTTCIAIFNNSSSHH